MIKPIIRSNLIFDFILCLSFVFLIDNCASDSRSQINLFSICYDSLMPSDSIALIIPGMNQTNLNPGYDSIGDYYKKKGITPIFININWKSVGPNRLSTAAIQIDSFLKDSFPDSRLFLFGFSFGAVVTLRLSHLVNSDQVILCSMSPLFAEDRAYQIFPFKQLMNFFLNKSSNRLSYSDCTKNRLFFLYGDHDSFLINNAIIKKRESSFKYSKTIFVENGRHKISDHTYLKAVKDIIESIGK